MRRDVLPGLHVRFQAGLGVDRRDARRKVARRPDARRGVQGGRVVALEPKTGEPPGGRVRRGLPQKPMPFLHRLRVEFRVEVRVHAEDVSRRVVGGRHGRQRDVALVLPPGPIDHVLLPVHAHVKARDLHVRESPLPVGQERQGLPVEEVDAFVQHFRVHVRRLADPAQRHLADQHGEDRPVLVRLPLLGDGVDPGRLDRKSLPAGFATVSRAADRRRSEGVVGPRHARRDAVVFAEGLGAGRRRVRLLQQAVGFLENAEVALERESLPAGVAADPRRAGTASVEDVGIDGVPSASDRLRDGHAEIGTGRGLAMVDVDARDRGRNLRRGRGRRGGSVCVWHA